MVEKPKGSNRGDSVDALERRFGMKGEPWCAMEICYRLRTFGINIWTASAIAIIAQAKRAGYEEVDARAVWAGHRTPKAGWLAIKGRSGGHHVDGVPYDWKEGEGRGYMVGGNVSDRNNNRPVLLDLRDRHTYTTFMAPPEPQGKPATKERYE